MKKTIVILAILTCVAMLTASVFAADEIKVIVDGEPVEFDVPPQNVNGRILVPLRAIFERLGADIIWDDSIKTVTATRGDTVVTLAIDDVNPTVNGVATPIDQPGIIVGSRVLAPLRFAAEAFGGAAYWDEAGNTAYITLAAAKPNGEPPAQFGNSTVGYGEPDMIHTADGPLLASVRFPNDGGIVGEVVGEWAGEIYENALYRINRMIKTNVDANGKVDVNFDSYLTAGRYAGVLENGLYTHSNQLSPVEIIRAFNFDVERGAELAAEDIWDYGRLEDIISLASGRIREALPEAADYLDDMDDSWIGNIVIGGDGIIMIFERGAFLPDVFGTVKIILPYAELGDALSLNMEPAPEPPRPEAAPASQGPDGMPDAQAPDGMPDAQVPASASDLPQAGLDPSVASDAGQADSISDAGQAHANAPETPEQPDEPVPSPKPTPEPATEPTPAPAPTPTPTPEPTPAPSRSGGRSIDPSKPMISLTFDDGPSKYTAQILNTLEKHNSAATFCVLGNLVEGRRDTVLRAHRIGCEIVGHSWDHKNLTALSESDIKKQILDTGKKIESITGSSPKIYRPPYGAVNDKVKNVSKNLGYSLLLWSVDPQDWKSKNADAVYNAIMKNVKNGSIILCHDLYGSTATAMERVVPELIKRGYQLVTVSELMKHSGGKFEAGKTYGSVKL
jgi:peptidoglycan/xylan/chitin deacetylase (PgdA/CDA1 family)